jgi:hypothetical protein
LAYLGDAILDTLALVGVAWLVYQIVMGFIFLLPWLLMIAVFGLTLRASGAKRPDPVVS